MSRFVRWQVKLAKYKYEVVYKARKINANTDAFSRNPISSLSLKILEKTDPKESSPRCKSLCKRFPKGGTATNSGSEKTQSDINSQPARTNTDTENKRDESSSENVNSDMKTRIHRSPFFIYKKFSRNRYKK